LEVYPDFDPLDENYDGSSYLKFSPTATNQYLLNTGLNSNRSTIKSFTVGEEYCVKQEILSNLVNNTTASSDYYEIIISEYTSNSDGTYTFITKKNNDNDVHLFEKSGSRYVCQYSLSEEAYKKTKVGIFIKRFTKNPLYIKKLLFYKYLLDGDN
jgi:hypothetical protein